MIDVTMPALSPTMETGTLAKWHVAVGDTVKSGDIIAEIETDKATMEVEAVDEGTVAELLVAEGSEGVPVGQVILRLAGEGESAPLPRAGGVGGGNDNEPPAAVAPVTAPPVAVPDNPSPGSPAASPTSPTRGEVSVASVTGGDRIIATPLARRIAGQQGVDLASVAGSGPRGRIVKADVEAAASKPATVPASGAVSPPPTPPASGRGDALAASAAAAAPAPAATPAFGPPFSDIPHSVEKLGNVRKVIARRLTEAKQTVPHFYLTSDIRLDALLKLRADLNAALEGRGVKLSVNDLIIKALAVALRQVPKANVSFIGDSLVSYTRADISVAVAAPSGLITPIITGADAKAVSQIATEMKALADKARAGKLQPHEFQGGTASLSNLGMYGIKQFDAVINPPQGMILAVGAGEKRPWVVNDALGIATVMTATGSFDHRAIDGADGAELMKAFRELVEAPLGLVA